MQAAQITKHTKNITELEIRIISPQELHANLSRKCKFTVTGKLQDKAQIYTETHFPGSEAN